jgi:hypothetical protein
MKPLVISRFSIVSCLGIGEATMLAALRSGASGLQPCTFETVNLETYVGQVAGLDEFRIPEALSAFDCRNNRLAEMAIVGDGFELAVAAAVERYGPGRIGKPASCHPASTMRKRRTPARWLPIWGNASVSRDPHSSSPAPARQLPRFSQAPHA